MGRAGMKMRRARRGREKALLRRGSYRTPLEGERKEERKRGIVVEGFYF